MVIESEPVGQMRSSKQRFGGIEACPLSISIQAIQLRVKAMLSDVYGVSDKVNEVTLSFYSLGMRNYSMGSVPQSI